MALRRVIELLARGRRLTRHMPARFGGRPLVVSPDAALRWLKPGEDAFEDNLLQLADHWVMPGDLVWDVGANVGVFSVAAAHRSGKTVIAIEADPFLADLLRDTAEKPGNAELALDVLCVAIGDHNGFDRFSIARRGRASNGLARGALSTQHGGSRQAMTVPMITLDALLDQAGPPDLVKIDVEGGEAIVMAGATRLLTEARPLIYIEVTDHTRDAVVRQLLAADYSLCDGDQGLADPIPMSQTTCNILARPQ